MTTELKKQMRKFIYGHFFEFSIPPTLEQLIEHFNTVRDEILSNLYSLHEDHQLVIDKKINKIIIAHPFAGIPTSFIVQTKLNRRYFATCAWDSIAMHVAFGENVEISSYCHHCNTKITLSLANEKIVSKTPSDVLIHFQYPAKVWWNDIIDTCYNTMNFYCSPEHLDEWVKLNPDKRGRHLDDEQIMDISVLLYKNKMEFDYQRPSVEDLQSRFTKNDLVGDFWEI